MEEDRSCELFVGNLVKEGPQGDHNEENLKLFFDQFGIVSQVDVKRDANGINKGFAFVKFSDPEAVDAVMKNHEHNLVGGVWLDCKRSLDRSLRGEPAGKGKGKGGGGPGAYQRGGPGPMRALQQPRPLPPRPMAGPAPSSGMLAAALLHPSVCPPGMVPGWVPVGDPNAMTLEELGLAPTMHGRGPPHRARPY